MMMEEEDVQQQKEDDMDQDEDQDGDDFQNAQDMEEDTQQNMSGANKEEGSFSKPGGSASESDIDGGNEHKIAEPAAFLDHLWNEVGPSHGSMLIACKYLEEEQEYEDFMKIMGPEYAHGTVAPPEWITSEMIHCLAV